MNNIPSVVASPRLWVTYKVKSCNLMPSTHCGNLGSGVADC